MRNLRIACLAVLPLIFTPSLSAQEPQDGFASALRDVTDGRPAQAKEQLTRALQDHRSKKDGHGEALTLLFLGLAEAGLGNADGARAHLKDAGAKMGEQKDVIGAWFSLLTLSQLEAAWGRWNEALAGMEGALAVLERAKVSPDPLTFRTFKAFASAAGLPSGMLDTMESGAELMKPILLQYFLEPITRDHYGSLLTEAGQLEKAEAELNAAAAGTQFFQGMYDFSIAGHFGDLRYRQKRYDEARAHYEKSLSGSSQILMMNPMGDQAIKLRTYERLARLEAVAGNIDEALAWNDKALEIGRTARIPLLECVTLETRGRLLMRAERPAEAEKAFREAMKIAQETKNVSRQAAIEFHFGTLAVWSGSYGTAASHLERSVQLYKSLNEPMIEAAAWGSLAHAYLLTDNVAAAEDALAHARELVGKHDFQLGRDIIGLAETWVRFRKDYGTSQDVKASLERFLENVQAEDIEIGDDIEQIVRHVLKAIETGHFARPAFKANVPVLGAYAGIAEGMQQRR